MCECIEQQGIAGVVNGLDGVFGVSFAVEAEVANILARARAECQNQQQYVQYVTWNTPHRIWQGG